jgi:hypothetical protein
VQNNALFYAQLDESLEASIDASVDSSLSAERKRGEDEK